MISRPQPSDLGDYGLIGDLRTAALVSRFGSIDWACLPRFESSSVFARILDPERGGFHEIVPDEPFRAEQAYLAATAILLTRFHLPKGRILEVSDFMPVSSEQPPTHPTMIARLAEAHGGPVRVRVTFAPRFDYGRAAPEWAESSAGWIARSNGTSLLYRAEAELRPAPDQMAFLRTITPDSPLSAEIIGGEERVHVGSIRQLLEATRRFWHGWVHTSTVPLHVLAGRWHPWVERSEITLKLLSSAETGAFVAAPTTSLPEWPGGPRNWDYRYAWIRDAAFTAQALLLLGHAREAYGFLHWMVAHFRRSPDGLLRVMYPVHDGLDLTEREVDGLAGFLGSKPVRVGNAAVGQFQLDIYGEIMDAASLLAERDLDHVRTIWPSLALLGEAVERMWTRPDQGIWEIRGPPTHYVHSKLMAWVALDRAAALARLMEGPDAAPRWRASANQVRDEILARGLDPKGRAFVQAFGSDVIDAANLRIPLVGFLPADDPRVLGTVERVIEELGSGPFVYRYRNGDGLDGPEGTFLPCAFWLVEVLARGGQAREAEDRFRLLLKAASPAGLLSEEYDPERKLRLGNFPQAFSHIGLLRAALALGLARAPAEVREDLSYLPVHLAMSARTARSPPPADWDRPAP